MTAVDLKYSRNWRLEELELSKVRKLEERQKAQVSLTSCNRTGMLHACLSEIKTALKTKMRQRFLGRATKAEEFGKEVRAVD